MDTSSPPPPRWWKRRTVRLTVRTMMFLVLILAVGLGWVVHQARVQRDTVAAIRQAGGWVLYNWESTHLPAGSLATRYAAGFDKDPNGKPASPQWLIDRLGPDYFGDVTMVRLGARATDADLALVGGLVKLEELHAEAASQLTDAGLARLRGLTRLTGLKLRSVKLTSVCLADLGGLTRLQFLSLGISKFADGDLAHLSGLTGLKTLLLNGSGITDAGMTHLAPLVRLRWLSIGPSSGVTSAGLASLRGMRGLVRLTLMECRVTDLAPIRLLGELEELVFRKAPLDDSGLAAVAEMGALRTFALPEARITDAGLIHLSGMDRLSTLTISGTEVTDVGLERLTSVKSLGRLNVKGTKVTDAGIASLQKALPKVQIIR